MIEFQYFFLSSLIYLAISECLHFLGRAQIGLDMCVALKELHQLGVIHRDVKPANIIRIQKFSAASTERKVSIRAASTYRSDTSLKTSHHTTDTGIRAAVVKQTYDDGDVQSSGSTINFNEFNKSKYCLNLGSQEALGEFQMMDVDCSGPLNVQKGNEGLQVLESPLKEKEKNSMEAEICSESFAATVFPGAMAQNTAAPRIQRLESAELVRRGSHSSEFTYKLIDLGSAVHTRDVSKGRADENSSLATFTQNEFAGTPAYSSPESFLDPSAVSFAADVWSLGVTIFHLVSRQLPFDCSTTVATSISIASDLNSRAPDIRDVVSENLRSCLSSSFAEVLARCLEKRLENRFCTVDELATGLHGCLVHLGEEIYTVFISYREASERFHALLLFDLLNNTTTPAGHRVIVYLDSKRLVKGEDWEEGFSFGLLNSLVALPLISEGVLQPLLRLTGAESDAPDNVLKELIMMQVLKDGPANLEVIFPILIGKPRSPRDSHYPGTGNFFKESSSKLDLLCDHVSLPLMNAVIKFLEAHSISVPETLTRQTVKSTIQTILALQGAKIWDHPEIQPEIMEEDTAICRQLAANPPDPSLDMSNLCMLKAEIRSLVPGIHQVIDRAYFKAAKVAMKQRLIIGRFSSKNINAESGTCSDDASNFVAT